MPLFFSIDTLTVPLPDPLEPEAIPIQSESLDAVQLQDDGAVTLTVSPLLPFLFADRLVGLTTNVHVGCGDGGGCDGGGCDGGGPDAAACWVTVNVCPAMDSVADRAAPLFTLTVNPTEPLPVPLVPDVIDIHPAPLVAVQAQPAPAVTAIDAPLPPAAANDWLPGEIPYEQDDGGVGAFGGVGFDGGSGAGSCPDPGSDGGVGGGVGARPGA